MNITIVAIFIGILVFLILYALFIPRASREVQVSDAETENKFTKFLNVSGTEIYSVLPSELAGKLETSKTRDTQLLLQKAGNPWNLKASQFLLVQIIFGVIGLTVGCIIGYLMDKFGPIHIPFFGWGVAFGLLGFVYPKTKHREIAKKRDIDFRRQLPDALDLIIISLSTGATFSTALREALPNMREGVLKEEFTEINKRIDSGKTLNSALEDFIKKSPSESVSTFVRALQQATEMNTPMIEVLEARADASRQEYFSLLQQRTAMLESKMMMVLTPTLVPAILIVSIAPAIESLMGTMG